MRVSSGEVATIADNHIVKEADALVMDLTDHVATALRDAVSGEVIIYRLGDEEVILELQDDIAFGHKVAIVDLAKGDLVKKYGEVIGRTTQEIRKGQHVHVHNVEGIRGRGDQAKEGN